MRNLKLVLAVGVASLLTHQGMAREFTGNFELACYEQSHLESYNILIAQQAKAGATLEEEWGRYDANDPELRSQLEKYSELRRAFREIRSDLVDGNPYRAQGALYKILELLNDPLISERAFAKTVLKFCFSLDDIGLDPGLSAAQVDRLLVKAIENDERVHFGAKAAGLTNGGRVLQYAVRKAAFLDSDWERLLKVIKEQAKSVKSPQRKVDLAVGYIWVYELSQDEAYLDSAKETLKEIVDTYRPDRCRALVVGRAATHLARILTASIYEGNPVDDQIIARALDVASIARSSFGGIDASSYRGYAFEVSAELMQAVAPYITPQGARTVLKERAKRYAELARMLR